MADNDNALIQAGRVDPNWFPPNFPEELRLYFIKNNSDLKRTATGTRDAIQSAADAAQQAGSALEGVTDVQQALDILDDLIVRIINDYVSITATGQQSIASTLSTAGYLVNGTQVVKARETGWTPSGGAGTKGGMNANQTYSVGGTYDQAQITAIANGLIEVRKLAQAMQAALTAHGLIGS